MPSEFDSFEQRNALYFPFINVPNTTRFHHILLYWEKIYSIVPVENLPRTALFPHMQGYVEAGIVSPIRPREYMHYLDYEIFDRFLERTLRTLPRKKREGKSSDWEPQLIHAEKLEIILNRLEESGLANLNAYPWYAMPRWVAMDLMELLALSLGRLREIQAAPVTDVVTSFSRLGTSSNRGTFREVILGNLLPVPVVEPSADFILQFKKRHGDSAKRFRRLIEEEAIRCSAIPDDTDRQDAIEATVRRLNVEKQQLLEEMGSAMSIKFSTVAILLSGTLALFSPGHLAQAGAGLGLMGTLAQFSDDRRKRLLNPLAYAVLAEKSMGRRRS